MAYGQVLDFEIQTLDMNTALRGCTPRMLFEPVYSAHPITRLLLRVLIVE